jgi:hypothetical protein
MSLGLSLAFPFCGPCDGSDHLGVFFFFLDFLFCINVQCASGATLRGQLHPYLVFELSRVFVTYKMACLP